MTTALRNFLLNLDLDHSFRDLLNVQLAGALLILESKLTRPSEILLLAFLFKLNENNRKELFRMDETPVKARMRCREIMTSSVKTATRDMPLQDVAILMRDGDMGSIPVVEVGGWVQAINVD